MLGFALQQKSMANKVISMQQIRALIQLLEKGYSLRSISAQLGVSRQPVTLYATRLKNSSYPLEALRELPDSDLANIVYPPATPPGLSDTARRQDFNCRSAYFLSELKRPGVTRLLLWEEYRKEYTDCYRYTQFCILLKEAGKLIQASMHLIHKPAEMVMVDFAGDKMSYVDNTLLLWRCLMLPYPR
jgi:hypothetical protein